MTHCDATNLCGPELRRYVETHILPHVETPAQYTGGELNQIVKDPASVKTKVALGMPDTYALGMSSLGLKVLYHVWNLQPDTLCERVFAPWPDMEALMREHRVPLYSLESFTPIRNFDVLALSVAYEGGFTNILTMLDLAGIPLKAEERSMQDPFVIMGGHTAFAPEPIADFIDAFCIGEGEELALDVSAKITELKTLGLDRETLLYRLCREVPGVYVPRFYRFEYFPDNTIADVLPLKNRLPFPVKRRVVADFDKTPFPTKQIVSYVQTVHERFAIEIMRGCVNGCRFCQAGMITRTQRQRSPETIIRLAQEGFEQTGYDEVGLLSLSSSDYAGITDLARRLNDHFEPMGVGISLPSLRIGTVLATLPKEMSRVRKGGLTIAPEAASERLRNIINKPVRDDHLLEGCREAFKSGYNHVKLYFMLGLPGETDDDLRAIGTLSDRVAMERTKIGKGPAKVAVSVSSFVPKCGTPFQWSPMLSRDEWKRRQNIIRDSTHVKTVKVKVHDPETSYLEGILSRGDRRLGKVIERAWRNGARFDGWDEHLKLDIWMEAFSFFNMDADWIGLRQRELDEILPWVIVNDTVSEAFLKRELNRSYKGMVTLTCADPDKDPCFICDACDRSPLYEKKEAMLAASVAGSTRDTKYSKSAWTFPAGALTLLMFLLCAAFTADAGEPVAQNRGAAVTFRADRILVKPKGSANLSALHVSLGSHVLQSFTKIGQLQVVRLAAGTPVRETIAKYVASGLVEYAEPDYEVHISGNSNDPQFTNGTQWGLHNSGQDGGVAGADIHAPEAWEIQNSASGVVVAVVDTGVRYTHEDLAANMWVNPGEIAGNGIDDDGNGIVDDVYGINAVDNTGDPRDDHGHGTHVAGTIGAVGNNGIGISGVAWQVKIMACKALDGSGSGSISTIVKCMDFARTHGANIMNFSLGGYAPNEAPVQSLKDAIVAARNAGIIVVAAAGNESNDIDSGINFGGANYREFPAGFDTDNIVSVTATNRADALSYFSSFGLSRVDLGAPGEDIISTYFTSDSSYISFSGTSMATPHVSGALALMKARFSTESYLQILNRVFANTDPVEGLRGISRTGGRLDLFKALASTTSRPENDDFASSIVVTGPSFTVSGINVDATKESSEPNHAGNPGGKSVWWSWTAPESGKILATTDGSSFDTLLAVYTGSALTGLVEITSNNDSPAVGTASRSTFTAVAGTTYTLAVDGLNGASGSIILSLKNSPSNDNFSDAIVIVDSSLQTGLNVNATREAGEPFHAGIPGGKSLWWSWTALESGRLLVTTAGSDFDTVLAVYSGSSVAGLTETAGNNNEDALFGINTSRVEFDAVAGTVYGIAVDGADGVSGTIALKVKSIKATVRLFATVSRASESNLKAGKLTVTRTGSIAENLIVKYHVFSPDELTTPLAENGTDFDTLSGSITIIAGSASATVAVTPVDDAIHEGEELVILKLLPSVDYELSSHAIDIVFIQDNDKFQISSAVTADPSPAVVNRAVDFKFMANGDDQLVFYFWDFGDGTSESGSNTIHLFTAVGTYLVTATAIHENTQETVSSTINLQVNPPGQLDVTALSLRLNFARFDGDSIVFDGTLPIPEGFVVDGRSVSVEIGGLCEDLENIVDTTLLDADGVCTSFSLDRNGSASGNGASFKFHLKRSSGKIAAQTAGFSVRWNRIDLADSLQDEGLTADDIKNIPVKIPVTVVFNGSVYHADVPAVYSTRAGRTGTATFRNSLGHRRKALNRLTPIVPAECD